MSKVNKFSLILNKEQSIYLAGEKINGSVYIQVEERFKINSVSLNCTGIARTNWYVYFYKK